MATERLINSDQGSQIITKLQDIAQKIDDYTKGSLPAFGMGYATCSTATSTAAKTVTLTGYSLNEGALVSIKFTNAVGANATLNINSKGAKSIYYNGAAITAGVIGAGDIATFLYTNNQYQLVSVDTTIGKKQDKVLGSWTAGTATTHQTPAGTDTVLQALQKIDNNQRNDESNISLLNPTTYIQPTLSADSTNANLRLIYGGYYIVGKLVGINMKFSIESTITKGNWLFENLPKCMGVSTLSDGTSLAPISVAPVMNGNTTQIAFCKMSNTATGIAILTTTGSDMTAGTYIISGYYLSE